MVVNKILEEIIRMNGYSMNSEYYAKLNRGLFSHSGPETVFLQVGM